MTTASVHPRLRARRVAVRRAEGRRRLHVLLVAAGLVAVAIGGWAISRSPLLDLDHLRIDAAPLTELSTAQQADVAAAADLEHGTPLFDLDLGHVDAAVESLPWVRSAHVAREWPGSVRISVEPRVAVATVGTAAGGRLLIDVESVLIGAAPDATALPVISLDTTAALGALEPAALGGIVVATAIPADLLPWIDGITVATEPGPDGRPTVGLDLIGTARVALGSTELITDKLTAVRSILEGTILACVDLIDVAVPELTTVTRVDGCATGEPAAAVTDGE